MGVLVAELALRLLGIAPARFTQPRSLESADKRWALDLYPSDPRGDFDVDLRAAGVRRTWSERGVPDVERRWERTPVGVGLRFSAELCRGGDIAPSDGRARVVVIGDSFTEGQGVREQDTFSARLDRALDAQVINCGRRGYDFPRLSEWFDIQTEQLAPDVVLYAMVLNDPEQSDAFRARQRFLDDWILDRRRMLSDGDGGDPPAWPPRLVQVLEDRLEGARVGAETTAWYRGMVGAENREGWEATLTHLERMDAAMRERGGRLVVALWPLLVDLEGDYPFRDVHRAIGEALRARDIAFVDALDAFLGQAPSALWVHDADHHPNADAHARFAEAVGPTLDRALP